MELRYFIYICLVAAAVNFIVYFSHFLGHQKTGTNKECRGFLTSSFITTAGVGNVMFQYASMYGIAQKLGMLPVLTEEQPLLRHFRLTVPLLKELSSSNWPQALEAKSNKYDEYLVKHLNPCYNLTVIGYFQSWKYFQQSELDIREQFRFTKDIVTEVQQDLSDFVTEVTQPKSANVQGIVTFIGMHIRRGDFLDPDKVAYGYTVADLDYIQRAVHHTENRIIQSKNNIFVVTTDDPEWAMSNLDRLNRKIFYSPYQDAVKDLALLSQCNHSIITVGTFSWWSGWLAGGEVIYYRNFPRANSELERAFSLDKRDYYPASWIGL